MRKILILDTNYPSATHLYGDWFVHARVKEYQKHAIVRVVSFFRNWEDYEYEGVQVYHAPKLEDLRRIYKEFAPTSIFIHFYNRQLFDFIKSVNVPVLIWVHGYEALGWYRRLFNYTYYEVFRNIHSIIFPNLRQMIGFRKLISFSNKNKRVHFIFVSDWMKRVAEVDSFISIKNNSIIPNPINTDLFLYEKKNADQRRKILMIRSFASKKYANDIAVKAIEILSHKPFFKDLHFSIYGQGIYFKPLTESLKKFKNIDLCETFLENRFIPDIHRKHGLFLCPTRQDAQGVSMCEAMSSGLVPLTSNCTAIPEFVTDGYTGLLSNSAEELAASVEKLFENPSMFETISKEASNFISSKCGIDNIVLKELSIENNMLN